MQRRWKGRLCRCSPPPLRRLSERSSMYFLQTGSLQSPRLPHPRVLHHPLATPITGLRLPNPPTPTPTFTSIPRLVWSPPSLSYWTTPLPPRRFCASSCSSSCILSFHAFPSSFLSPLSHHCRDTCQPQKPPLPPLALPPPHLPPLSVFSPNTSHQISTSVSPPRASAPPSAPVVRTVFPAYHRGLRL